MTSVSFHVFFSTQYLGFVLVGLYLTELFYLIIYTRKYYWVSRKNIPSVTIMAPAEVQNYVTTQLLLLVTLKLDFRVWPPLFSIYTLYLLTVLIFIKILLSSSKVTETSRMELNNIFLALIFSAVAIANFYLIENLLLFVFILEVIGITYYFFFLNHLSKSKSSFIKFKNIVSMYLWTSFLVLVFLSCFIFILVIHCGTLDFLQLDCLASTIPSITLHLLIVALFWKSGAPGFHFIKIQLYQYLPVYSILVFSVISLFINYFLLQFIVIMFSSILLLDKGWFLIYLLIVNFALLLRVQVHLNFYEFLAYSATSTWATLILFGVI